jgi:hypothetical protein
MIVGAMKLEKSFLHKIDIMDLKNGNMDLKNGCTRKVF